MRSLGAGVTSFSQHKDQKTHTIDTGRDPWARPPAAGVASEFSVPALRNPEVQHQGTQYTLTIGGMNKL